MIQKFRDKAITLLAAGFGLIVLGGCAYAVCSLNKQAQLGRFLEIILMIAGSLIYMWGCVDLAKAKGYSSEVAAAILAPGLLCCLGFVIIAPLIVIFGLKDKTGHSRNHSRQDSAGKNTLTMAVWSISLSSFVWVALIGLGVATHSYKPVEGSNSFFLGIGIFFLVLFVVLLMSAVLAMIVLKRRSKGESLAIASLIFAALPLLIFTAAMIHAAFKSSHFSH